MDATRFLLGTLVGGVVLFLAGGLIWGLTLAGAYPTSEVEREAPLVLWLALAQLGWGAMLTIILGKWPGGATAAGGLKAAAIIGLALSIALGMQMHSMMTLPVSAMSFVDPLLWAVYFGVGGAAIGWTLGRGAPGPA